MIRTGLMALFVALGAPVAGLADSALPPAPGWRTEAEGCSWSWREGGEIALWAETCDIDGRIWQVLWDDARAAFVTRRDDADMGIAVQVFSLPGGEITALSDTLVAAGNLEPEAACTWRAVALRPAPRSRAFHVLTPDDPAALAAADSGEIPEPVCGPYGASTHGVRYFMTDLRWAGRAIFVEEGQERPLFDPSSITLLH